MTMRFRAVITRGDQDLNAVAAFGQFRKHLFINRLHWPLRSFRGEEIDEFDSDDSVYCVLFCDKKVVGGFRALPTDGPYLAKSVFPELANERAYPSAPDIWEISRFGVTAVGHSSGVLSQINYGLMFRFAQRKQATALVAIADLAYERFLQTIGIFSIRYGSPRSLPGDCRRESKIVAGEIPIAAQNATSIQKLISALKTVEIIDETLVLGRSRISA